MKLFRLLSADEMDHATRYEQFEAIITDVIAQQRTDQLNYIYTSWYVTHRRYSILDACMSVASAHDVI